MTWNKFNTLSLLIAVFALNEAAHSASLEENVMSKLNQAKLLRNDIINHINYLKEIIKNLDNWAFTEIANMTKCEEKLTVEKYILIETKINNTQNNITEIFQELSVDNDDNLNVIKERSKLLQDNLELLNQEIYDNNTWKNVQLVGDYLGNSNIINNFNNISKHIAIILKRIEEKEDSSLADECIKAIKKKQFTKAVHILNEIKYENDIYYIVKNIYNNTENNFDLVLQFSKIIRNMTQSFYVYKALNNEMDINEHNSDSNKILRFIKACETGIINRLNGNNDIKIEVKYLINHLKNKLKILGRNYLIEILLNSNETFILENSLFQKIFLLDDIILGDICKDVLSELNSNNTENIIEKFKNILKELTSIYLKNIKHRGNLFKLGYFFKDLLNINKNKFNIQNDVENLKNNLPEFARNIVFSKKVCIKNIGLNEYLHLSNETFDKNKYNINTKELNNNEITIYETWQMIRAYEHMYFIKNSVKKFSNLYADIYSKDDYYYRSTEGHNVYNWVDNNELKEPIWEIDPFYCMDSCLIENSKLREHLYANEDTNHLVYTNHIDLKNSDYWRWNFIDCSHI